MRRRRPKTPEEVRSDARWFAAARGVLRGGQRPPLEPGSLKLFGFLFDGGCDATVSNEGFFVRFTWNPGPHEYDSELAPTILGHLLGWAGVSTKCSELRGAPLAPHGLQLVPRRPTESRALWLLEDGELVRFAMRVESDALRGAAWPPEIMLPSREPVYRDVSPPRPCPRCGVELSRVRDLGEAMICGTCGRSFPSW